MPTTRRQTAIAEGKIKPNEQHASSTSRRGRRSSKAIKHEPFGGDPEMKERGAVELKRGKKREAEQAGEDLMAEDEESLSKKSRTSDKSGIEEKQHIFKHGTIERGHIYFLYRPRVQREEVQSIDDIRNFHMLLVSCLPEFMTEPALQDSGKKFDPSEKEEAKMKALAPGADAIPAKDDSHSTNKHFRLITVGKKKLPDPQNSGAEGTRQKEISWAVVTAAGDDLESLKKGLQEQSYDTKTRGTRHEGAARLVARGDYAIVNSEGKTLSSRETHFGYHVSHPTPKNMGDVQRSLGISPASSYVLQVKNPRAPSTGPQPVHSKPAGYPAWIMHDIFEEGKRGNDRYGLRFAPCGTPELLDYKGAELLLIAAREGEEGLEKSLGEGRGGALSEVSEKEAHAPIQQVFDELGLEPGKFPAEPIVEGSWI